MSLADELEGMIAEMNAAEANRLAALGRVFGKGSAGVVEGKSASQWADHVLYLRAKIQGRMLNNRDAILTALRGRDADQAKVAALEKKIDDLKTVMVAAAEEIHEHWDAHCDKEGYGPANLMNRLERGLASTYSCYSPGAFAALHKKVAALEKQIDHYTVIGVDAYDIACEEMEKYHRKRAQDGKEIGTERSLVDGMGWIFRRLDEVEAKLAQQPGEQTNG